MAPKRNSTTEGPSKIPRTSNMASKQSKISDTMESVKKGMPERFAQKKLLDVASKETKIEKIEATKPVVQESPKEEIRCEIEPGLWIDRDEANARLRVFDLNTKYGPCMSCTRLERWNRAKKLNMDPPQDILRILESFPDMADRSIWHGRVHPEEPIVGF
eukprot:751951-Hanusia_phi.AAC.2